MEGLQLVVVIGAAIIGGGWIARRLRLPPPLVLLLLGVAIGFVPLAGDVQLPPDVVLLLFLPALLYWESITTSLREIRSNLRVILLAAIGLVLITAVGVGAAASALGLPWPIALALGAILAPTDATAVASVARGLPRRILTTLRAESLINDGTALVLYSVAIGAAVSGSGIELGPIVLEFLWSYLVAIAIGLAIGFVIGWLRRFVAEPSLVNTLIVLTPFLAFLPAELLHASGVVAVVVCGLVSSHLPSFDATAVARRQGYGFWEVATYILNGALFVLIGIQFHLIVTSVDAVDWPLTLLLAGVAIVLVLGIRLAWFNTIPYVLRAIDRRPSQRARRVHARQRFPGAWAGFRGAVSLAAALALPLETADGTPLPYRETLIAVTFAVILFTLVVQGLSMPAVVRWARLPPDPTEEWENLLAERTALQAALDAVGQKAEESRATAAVRDSLLEEYRARLDVLAKQMNDDDKTVRSIDEVGPDGDGRGAGGDGDGGESALRLALLPVKRRAIAQLRRSRQIDDVVLRRIQARLDAEEIRLAAHAGALDDEP